MISGKTALIAHIGYPTHSFKAPMIYNPYFEKEGIDAVVIPMGVKAEDFEDSFEQIFRFTNIHGALITMPHKVSVVSMLDEVTPAVRVAGSCNAVLLRPDGTLLGDMFDGAGFTRRVAGRGRCGEDRFVRRQSRIGQRTGFAPARKLSADGREDRLERPGRLR